MPDSFRLLRHISRIDAGQWNRLAGDNPFLRHEFLLALDDNECAVPKAGWSPHFLLLERDGALAAAMPLYLKSHSRGEYVFDHAWAHAFARLGLDYYPKLLAAVPFTPVPGPRLLAQSHADRVALARQAIAVAEQNELSSVHLLFGSQEDRSALEEAGWMFRENVQFHWFNRGYSQVDDFLADLTQQKRKKLRQDSKKALAAGIRFRWLEGEAIDDAALDFFYRCYHNTYMEHGNPPYLNRAFFGQLHATMPDAMVLILAEQDGTPIASAMNVRGGTTLYGRYWGSVRYVPGLHFETCYMQSIAYCITRKLSVFEGGAQGEHKLSRGMLPVRTYSAHWIRDARYAEAIADYLARETPLMDRYVTELADHSPFRKTTADT